VAGIAHRKETKENAPLYYKVNRDLAAQAARLAKAAGVKQFVFLSTMSVYGMETGHITRQTQPAPKSHYGKSKLEAEELLAPLADASFTITVLRPPMVYGKDCKGNFQSVIKLVKTFPAFPKVNNQRSMIWIENLCAYVAYCIHHGLGGLHLPQDPEYMNTSEMAACIAKGLNKKLYTSRLLGLCVKILLPFLKPAQKAFGSLTYAQEQPPIQAVSGPEAVTRSV
jgi:UDP-glucose 4-epimerase